MTIMQVYVSFGEVVDKITILELKIAKICDETKRETARTELGLLTASFGSGRMEKIERFKCALKHINELLWEVEDDLRGYEMRGECASQQFVQRAREVYFLNDRRAAIKRCIDDTLVSIVREVKSYTDYQSQPVFVLSHLGMGDQIIMSGLIRYLALFHKSVVFVAKRAHANTITFMYRDISTNIKPIYVDSDADISPAFGSDDNIIDNYRTAGYKILLFGQHVGIEQWTTVVASSRDFAEAFYKQVGIYYDVRWNHFFLLRDAVAEERLAARVKPAEPYAFVHDDVTRNMCISDAGITLSIVRPAGLGPDAPLLFDYLSIIEHAAEIHCIDSCFALMIDAMGFDIPGQKKYLHTYAKGGQPYKKLYKTEWIFVDAPTTN